MYCNISNGMNYKWLIAISPISHNFSIIFLEKEIYIVFKKNVFVVKMKNFPVKTLETDISSTSTSGIRYSGN